MTNNFKFGNSSLENLEGVEPKLVDLAKGALCITNVDFGIIDGLRTVNEQKKLVLKGASQTNKSKHLKGEAIDVMAYIGSRPSWELPLYYDIADAFKEYAAEHFIVIRWGGAWHIPNFSNYSGSAEEACDEYVRLRDSQDRSPFIDAGHFELN